jgi:hypothetical protein
VCCVFETWLSCLEVLLLLFIACMFFVPGIERAVGLIDIFFRT